MAVTIKYEEFRMTRLRPPTVAGTACSLLTEQEVTAVLGSDPSLVTLNLVASGGKADFDNIQAQDTTGALFAVTGLGDAAFAVAQGPTASIWFTHGDAMVAIVLVQGGGGSAPQDGARALAESANGRL
jgi:hypothetical protein